MDAPDSQAADLTLYVGRLAIGILVAILGAILWDFNARLKNVEEERMTREDMKDIVRSVLHEDETTRRRK